MLSGTSRAMPSRMSNALLTRDARGLRRASHRSNFTAIASVPSLASTTDANASLRVAAMSPIFSAKSRIFASSISSAASPSALIASMPGLMISMIGPNFSAKLLALSTISGAIVLAI